MKKMNKKGFTITELVIVIAVIAILAGVMIPTFGGIIEKANKSAAMQEAASQYKIDVAAIDAQIDKCYKITADTKVKAGTNYYTLTAGKYTKATLTEGADITETYYEYVTVTGVVGVFGSTLNDYTVVIDSKYTCHFDGEQWTVAP